MPDYIPVPTQEYSGENPPKAAPNDHLYAVLVGGTAQSCFWTDISMIYNTLLEKGYKKENIFVHFYDADGSYGQGGIYNDDLDGGDLSDDIDYDASLASLQTTFDNLSGVSSSNPEIPKLEKDDQLFVHFDSHGGSYDLENKGSFVLVNGGAVGKYLYDYQLAEWMEPIECAQILVTMQQCFSGGFKDDLTDYTTYPNTMCKNRRVITAADYNETAHMEIYITGDSGLLGGVYSEFDFYFFSALRGFYPDVFNDGDGYHPWEPSYALSEFPFYLYPVMVNHPDDYNPDEIGGNDDGLVQIGEAFSYMNDFNTYSLEGYYYSEITDFPQSKKTGLFTEDLFTLTGLTGEVVNDQTVMGNFLFGGEFTIKSPANVSINDGNFYLMNDAMFNVDAGASFAIGDNAMLAGVQGDCKLDVAGGLTVGDNVVFKGEEEDLELNLHNTNLQAEFDNATFENTKLRSSVKRLIVKNSTFTECPKLESYSGIVNIEDNIFTKTGVYLENISSSIASEPITTTITGNVFSNKDIAAIELLAYDFYNISDNEISNYSRGIYVHNSGFGKEYKIWNNEVSQCSDEGIFVYNSMADIYNNYIHDNGMPGANGGHGIWLGDHSNTQLRGNKDAHHNKQTQRIMDNEGYEVYIADHSFPKEFHYNIIIDEDNGADNQLVYYDESAGSGISLKDVTYNCWGDEFDPVEDLYPDYYVWEPTWCPPLGGSSGKEGAAQLYANAEDQFNAGDYAAAKATFKSVIEQYPDTKFAFASLHSLFALEKFDSDDYNALKEYYSTNAVIQADPKLSKESEFVASKCDVKLENWEDAILYFEGRLNAPESLQDSIFATIDLGHIYLLMNEGGNKNAYKGKLIEYIPVSKKAHLENRDYLLGLLPKAKISQTLRNNLTSLKEGELLQNVPNPFTDKTQLWYKVQSDADVEIKVYNNTGQLIRTFVEGAKTKGTHYVDMDASGLPAGIYFYSISINGNTTDSKKMTIMK